MQRTKIMRRRQPRISWAVTTIGRDLPVQDHRSLRFLAWAPCEFIAENQNICWGVNADAHWISTLPRHGHGDVLTDANGFGNTPCDY